MHSLPFVGAAMLGRSAGVFQLGSDVDSGPSPAKLKTFVSFLLRKSAMGSRTWSWFYFSFLRGYVVRAQAGLAKKAAAAALAPAA